jgi:hypothetical protein
MHIKVCYEFNFDVALKRASIYLRPHDSLLFRGALFCDSSFGKKEKEVKISNGNGRL